MYHVIVHREKSGIPHIRESGLQSPISIMVIVRGRNARLFGRRVVFICWRLHYESHLCGNVMMESKPALRMGPGVDARGTPLKRTVTKAALWRRLINRAAPLSMATY
ncbi:hypothetical protein C8J56DRAFT_900111 [Mycena floridula]|nr:hypothetical protein C8J56DRAFT_900111 [Mycena floridula]